ncbi:MAG: hypothetical protein ACR2OE_05340 [Thermomicrobiales bacterium]
MLKSKNEIICLVRRDGSGVVSGGRVLMSAELKVRPLVRWRLVDDREESRDDDHRLISSRCHDVSIIVLKMSGMRQRDHA